MASHQVAPKRFNMGGIHTAVYNLEVALASSHPVGVLIATHGREGNQFDLKDLVYGILQQAHDLEREGSRKRKRELVVVTLDQRNHGERHVSPEANQGFRRNPRHAVDMCSVYRGTTSDVRNLIDFIPAYLFPAGEKQIEEFWVTGISLGGHVSYLALTHEPRITLGIPIIGCPDYHTLLSRRIASGPPASGQTTLAPPVFPDSLAALIKRTDPVNSNYNLLESEGGAEKNPFWGKKILVLGGADDKLVPASIGRPFFEKLQVGPQGFKEEWIEEGCGHVCSPAMIERAGKFLWLHGLSYEKEVRSSL